MKRLLLPLGLSALAITVALVASAQLPDHALPVVLGVIAGIVASLPTSLLIVWRVSKTQTGAPLAPTSAAERPPTIIVVPTAPPAPEQPAPTTPSTPTPAPQPGLVRETRPFTIIGRDEAEA